MDKYLREYNYHKEPNKEWLCNAINSFINKEFHQFIPEKIEERNQFNR